MVRLTIKQSYSTTDKHYDKYDSRRMRSYGSLRKEAAPNLTRQIREYFPRESNIHRTTEVNKNWLGKETAKYIK